MGFLGSLGKALKAPITLGKKSIGMSHDLTKKATGMGMQATGKVMGMAPGAAGAPGKKLSGMGRSLRGGRR